MAIQPENKLLPYQLKWIEDRSRIKIIEKSRRVGITWATAFDCVLDAACGETNIWYIAYAEDAAQEFIRDALAWAETLGLVEQISGSEDHLEDEDGAVIEPALAKDGIRAFSLTFRSGKRITALSSSPRSLRGKQGRVIVDEAAFHPDLEAVKKAAMSLLMWGKGSRVEFISTHNGLHNPFNKMIEAARAGDEEYAVHKVTFDDALQQGLYKRICLVNNEDWTEDKELEWRAQVVREHGVDADEELFVVPRSGSGEGWFKRQNIPLVKSIRDISERPPTVQRAIRFWDFAATKPTAMSPDPDYTIGARVLQLSDGNFLVDDIVRCRLEPGEVTQVLLETASDDGKEVEVGFWLDPGAAGKADAASKTRALTGYVVHTPRAAKSKTDFAKPWATLVAQGRVYVLDRGWTEEMLIELERFPDPRTHDDSVDAISGAFDVFTNQDRYMQDWSKAWTGTW